MNRLIVGIGLLVLTIAARAETGADDPDWFKNLETIGSSEISAPSPWFGAVEVDSFFPAGNSVSDQERARVRTNLRGGWQGNISDSLKGRLALWWRYEARDTTARDDGTDANVVELDESYLDWQAGTNSAIRAGRQKIGFAYAQGFRVLDSFSPIDSRIPGYGQLTQMKLPQGSLGFSAQIGGWSHRAFLLLEQRKDLTDREGIFAQPSVDGVKTFGSRPGGIYSVSHSYGKWDGEVVIGEAFNPMILVDEAGGFYQRERSGGFALSRVEGAMRLFTENRWFNGTEVVSDSPGSRPVDGRQHLLGLTYTGFPHVALQLEARRNIFEHTNDDALFAGASYLAMEDRLETRWQHTDFRTLKASVDNLGIDYTWRDGLHFMGGLLVYNADSSSVLRPLADQDRLYLAVNYFW